MKNIIIELKRCMNKDRVDNRSEKKKIRERMRMRYIEIHRINFFWIFLSQLIFFSISHQSYISFFALSFFTLPFSFFIFRFLFVRFRENYDSYGVDENNGGGGDR